MRPIQYSSSNPVAIEKFSPPETLVKGNPRQLVESYFESADGRFRTGIWSGERGAYRLEFGAAKHEFFILLAGHVRLTPDDGPATDYRPGDACVVPAGFRGVFEILEDARKHYAVSE